MEGRLDNAGPCFAFAFAGVDDAGSLFFFFPITLPPILYNNRLGFGLE